MIEAVREKFNSSFSPGRYADFLADLDQTFNYSIPFRVAESPIFVSRELKHRLLTASNHIIDFLVHPDFKERTQKAIPKNFVVPNETDRTLFLALDFAVTKDKAGSLQPQLIEMQGFPSLFGWQDFLASKYKEHFFCPPDFNSHFSLTASHYQSKLKNVLLNGHDPENVILLEIDPWKQNTAIDFIITEKITGVAAVHIADLKKVGRRLFYEKNGKTIPIHRIYNRVIFDELVKRNDLRPEFNLTDEIDVEWAGHPNWFFRISKYTMPFIKSQYIPECKFLSEYESYPGDLKNYVLKPLFSFAGSGVIFNVKEEDLNAIPENERANFILQRKIQYEPVVQSPEGKVKAEIRLMFLWENDQPRPIPVTNVARLSRGEMIGVKFNNDKTWVGSSVCFFEPG